MAKPLKSRETRRASDDGPKQATNVSLRADLVVEARDLGINVSKACDRGLALAIAEEKSRRWLEESKEAIQSSNAYVAKHGLPLARYRRF